MNNEIEARPFEEYKEMIQNMSKEEMIKGLYDLSKSCIEKDNEIERLNNIINELNDAYCKVITKCEEMISSRFYMNDNAIKNYAGEIINVCKYYVGEAKELKGDSSNE